MKLGHGNLNILDSAKNLWLSIVVVQYSGVVISLQEGLSLSYTM